MELKSFREILLKKSEGNPYLKTLIQYTKDEIIADEVIDSLLKMAEPSAAMGRGANSALTHYAGQMTGSDVEQLRDALGHHISHYKGALKSMHAEADPTQKAKLRGVADQHLNRIIPLMHTAGRAGKHSGGKLVLDYVSTTPWESNYTTVDRHEHNGKLKEGTKDLGRRPAPSANRAKNKKAVPDYKYLEMAPHSGHPSAEDMPHKGGYPFEEIQLGSPAKRDSGQAYLPIEDVANKTLYTPHAFDNHPIHELADEPEHNLTPEQKDKFMNEVAGWKNSEHHKQWLQDHKDKYAASPEEYKKRGMEKPGHHYEGIPLQDQPDEARAFQASAKPKEEEASAQPAEQSLQQSSADTASQPKHDLSKPPEGIDSTVAKFWDSLPDEAKVHAIQNIKGSK